MVTIVFDDAVQMYFARQLVTERLQRLTAQFPEGIQPLLGPRATAFGELYQYTLTGPAAPIELKDLQEWVINKQLRTIPGVSEVNTWGGETKQYQITVDPGLWPNISLLWAMSLGGSLKTTRTSVEDSSNIMMNNTRFGARVVCQVHPIWRTLCFSPAEALPCCCEMLPRSRLGRCLHMAQFCETAKLSRAWSSC